MTKIVRDLNIGDKVVIAGDDLHPLERHAVLRRKDRPSFGAVALGFDLPGGESCLIVASETWEFTIDG